MTYLIIKLIHIFSVFIYGGFLFTDILFLSKMPQTLNEEEHKSSLSLFSNQITTLSAFKMLFVKFTTFSIFSKV